MKDGCSSAGGVGAVKITQQEVLGRTNRLLFILFYLCYN
jgi:hypothetical protein